MKPRLLSRLDLLAAEQETQLLETIRRQNAALKQTDHQRGVLASYRDRLAASWQNGAPVPAAQASRAGQFSAASHGAEAQIDHAAQLAAERLEAALADLAQVQARRRALGEASAKAVRQAERAAEQRLERDMPVPRSIFQP
jgi:hypothetical protein